MHRISRSSSPYIGWRGIRKNGGYVHRSARTGDDIAWQPFWNGDDIIAWITLAICSHPWTGRLERFEATWCGRSKRFVLVTTKTHHDRSHFDSIQSLRAPTYRTNQLRSTPLDNHVADVFFCGKTIRIHHLLMVSVFTTTSCSPFSGAPPYQELPNIVLFSGRDAWIDPALQIEREVTGARRTQHGPWGRCSTDRKKYWYQRREQRHWYIKTHLF